MDTHALCSNIFFMDFQISQQKLLPAQFIYMDSSEHMKGKHCENETFYNYVQNL